MFKVTKETDSHYVISHPDGHFMKIAKKGLSDDLHGEIKKMNKGGGCYSKGGQVNPKLQQSYVRVPVQTFDVGGQVQDNGFADSGIGQISDQDRVNQFADALKGPVFSKQMNPPPQAQPPEAPLPPPQQSPAFGAMNKMYEDQSNVLKGGINQEQRMMGNFQKSRAQWDQEAQNMFEDMQNDKLDFNRVWQNKDTGQKMLTGLGLVLSGIGSGLTGQQNMAQQVLDGEINRDVDQQKAQLGKKKTLYEMNLQRFKTDADATAATIGQLHDLTDQRMKLLALQQNSPMAWQAFQQNKIAKDARIQPVVNGVLQREAQAGVINPSANASGNSAANAIPNAPHPEVLTPQQESNLKAVPANLDWLKANGKLDKDDAKEARTEWKDVSEANYLKKQYQFVYDKWVHRAYGGLNENDILEREGDVAALKAKVKMTDYGLKRYPKEEDDPTDDINSTIPGVSSLGRANLGGNKSYFPRIWTSQQETPEQLANKQRRLNTMWSSQKFQAHLKGLQDRGLLPDLGLR